MEESAEEEIRRDASAAKGVGERGESAGVVGHDRRGVDVVGFLNTHAAEY